MSSYLACGAFVTLTLVASWVVGRSSEPSPAAQGASGAERTETVTVTEDEIRGAGAELRKVVTVGRGGTVRVRLAWQAGGYRWELDKGSVKGLRPVDEGKPKAERDRNVPGAPEFRAF